MPSTTSEFALKYIAGAEKVISYFGYWESCHDAEILGFSLRRPGLFTISVRALGLDAGLQAQGIMRYKHAIITFLLRDVIDLSLERYSVQNVIPEITIESKGRPSPNASIWESTGTSGWLEAKAIEVDLMLLKFD
jgi:Immunity protein 50